MARKKRKKTKRRQGKGRFGEGLRAFGAGLVKTLPVAGLSGLLFFLFVGVKEAIYADPALRVKEVVVEPADGLTPARIKAIEKDWKGTPIFKVDLEGIAAELGQDPEIRSARVLREVPSRLKITVERRHPFAEIRLAGKGEYGIISEDGMVLDVVKREPAGYVLIEALGSHKRALKTGRTVRAKGLEEAVAFLKAYRGLPLAAKESVTRILLDPLGNVSIVFGPGPEIRLGRDPVSRLKALDKIQPVLEGAGRGRIEYMDLQFEDVIIKRK